MCANALNIHTNPESPQLKLLTLQFTFESFSFLLLTVNSNEMTVSLEQRCSQMFVLQQNDNTGSSSSAAAPPAV